MGSDMAETARTRQMRRVILEFSSSGETAAEFGESRGFSPATLWYWKKRIADLDRAKQEEAPTPFIEVQISDRSRVSTSSFRVELKNSRTIELDAGFDEAALTRLVGVLESC